MTEEKIFELAGTYRDMLISKRNEHIYGKGQKVGLPLEMKQIESMVNGYIDGLEDGLNYYNNGKE